MELQSVTSKHSKGISKKEKTAKLKKKEKIKRQQLGDRLYEEQERKIQEQEAEQEADDYYQE